MARVVGAAANNLDQVIEIDKGSSSGIEVGMAVVNQAGLVGKVTQVTRSTARVMLVTDSRYSVAVKVTSASGVDDRIPTNTSPSGLSPSEIEAAGDHHHDGCRRCPGAIVPGVTLPDGSPAPDTTLPGAAVGADGQPSSIRSPVDPSPPNRSRPWTSSVRNEDAATPRRPRRHDRRRPRHRVDTGRPPRPPLAEVIEKEYGALEGRGRLRLPQIKFVQDSPSLSELVVGDLVETAGGSESLAPTGIPVGRVVNRADRPGSGGPLLDVELYADLARLNFVRVVLYKPLSEVDQ